MPVQQKSLLKKLHVDLLIKKIKNKIKQLLILVSSLSMRMTWTQRLTLISLKESLRYLNWTQSKIKWIFFHCFLKERLHIILRRLGLWLAGQSWSLHLLQSSPLTQMLWLESWGLTDARTLMLKALPPSSWPPPISWIKQTLQLKHNLSYYILTVYPSR